MEYQPNVAGSWASLVREDVLNFVRRWWKHILLGIIALVFVVPQVFAFGRYQIVRANDMWIVRLDRRTGELRAFVIVSASQSYSGPEVAIVEKGHYSGDGGIW